MRLLLCGLLLLAGCGYSTGFRLPDDHATVGVEFFGNQSPVRDLEVDFHDYLTDAVSRVVHARIVDPDEADYVVRGEVLSYARRRGIRSPDNVLLETGVRIAIRAELLEAPAPGDPEGRPRTVRETRAATESGYRLEEPLGEADARDRVLRNLADEVVIELFGYLATQEAP